MSVYICESVCMHMYDLCLCVSECLYVCYLSVKVCMGVFVWVCDLMCVCIASTCL